MKDPISLHAAALAAYALNLLLSATVIGTLTRIAARGLFRHRPSVRYFACLAALVGVLLSPLTVAVQGALGCGLLTLSLPASLSPFAAIPAASPTRAPVGFDAGAGAAPLAAAWIARGVGVALCVWGVGVAWGLARLVHGWKTVSRLRGGVSPWSAPGHAGMLAGLEPVFGRRALPPVFTSPRVATPVAVGLLRPAVILPEGLAETLTPAQLRHVLLHECAHVAFRHTVGGVVERLAGMLFWPHPLVHALCRDLARAREEVCDNVASQEDGAACYARTLFALATAQGTLTAPNLTSALALLGPGISLEERIVGLLDPRRDRMVRLKRGKLWAVVYAAVLVLGSTALVRVVAANGKAKADANGAPNLLFLKRVAEARAKAAGVVVGHQSTRRYASEAEAIAAKRAVEAEEAEAMAKRSAGHVAAPAAPRDNRVMVTFHAAGGVAAEKPVELRPIDEHLVGILSDGRPVGQVHFQPGPPNPEEREAHRKAEAERVAKHRAEAAAKAAAR